MIRMKTIASDSPKHTIPAVRKAMEMLDLLAREQGENTTKALALRLGMPRSTCYRILRSLIAKDWVRPLPDGGHALSLGLLPLFGPLRTTEWLSKAVQPMLETLAQRLRLTAKASVRQADYAVTIARCESPEAASLAVRLGASFHLAFGSSGTALLSELGRPEIHEILSRAPKDCWERQKEADVFQRLDNLQAKGWCADLGIYRPNYHAISAPFRDRRGGILASITVVGFPQDLPGERLAATAKILLQTIRQSERQLQRTMP
jgi:DNA-binding IclR family transcriptional regulator